MSDVRNDGEAEMHEAIPLERLFGDLLMYGVPASCIEPYFSCNLILRVWSLVWVSEILNTRRFTLAKDDFQLVCTAYYVSLLFHVLLIQGGVGFVLRMICLDMKQRRWRE